MRGRSPWARTGHILLAHCLPADPWMVEDEAMRRRLLADAKGTNRRKALAALGELRERYRLRLPLVEKKLGLRIEAEA